MAGLKDRVAELITVLDGFSEEAKNASGTIERLIDWFDSESKRLIVASLDTILNEVRKDAPNEPFKLHLVLMSPEERISRWDAGYIKPEGYRVLSIVELSRFIDSLKLQIWKGKWIAAAEFIKANRKVETLSILPTARIEPSDPVVTEQRDEDRWTLSDFLPAQPPYPPLPRGLFKDQRHRRNTS